LNDVLITGSIENTFYKRYVQNANPIVMQLNGLAAKLQTIAKSKADSDLIQHQQQQLAKVLQSTRDSIINKTPHSLLALILIAGKQPEIPIGMVVKTRADTLKAGQYIKKHFWDDVPFNDDRLLYTPFFDLKIENYFKFYVSPVADSVIKDMQYMLLYARTGKEMYPYLVTKFVNRYFNPDHAGQNKVFLYLFNDFLMRGDTTMFDARSKKLIFERAYALMANRVGDPAPPLDLNSATDGQQIPLYSFKSAYTLIVFWEPDCQHCQKELPRIDSIYRAKWKALDLKIYSVNINAALIKDAESFIKEKNISPDWIHVYQKENDAKKIADAGGVSYFQTYDISETPTLYLLDAQKNIVAKRLSIEQFDRLIAIKEKAPVVGKNKPE
jgi:thiol-disulfide isomerase/thioredoxin